MKNLTNIFTDSLLKKNLANNESQSYYSKYINILVSKTDLNNIQKDTEIALSKQLALVNFSECENFLRDQGYINKTEVMSYTKTDWSGDLKDNSTNTNNTSSSSVSFSMYSSNGTLIDKSLCSNISTNIQLYVKDINSTDLGDKGDPNSEYFNSLCIPMRINDTAYTINDRRQNEFDNKNTVCSAGCTYLGILFL